MTTVSDYFRDYAPKYDSFTLRAMPRYEEMLGEIVRCLPDQANDILELGCGTGSLTALLSRHYANSTITAIDASAEMIELARDRLGSLAVPSEQVRFVESLFEELDLPERSCDVIASNMSLHHIVDKAPFYGRLREALRSGGMLVLGDELTGALPAHPAVELGRLAAVRPRFGRLERQRDRGDRATRTGVRPLRDAAATVGAAQSLRVQFG